MRVRTCVLVTIAAISFAVHPETIAEFESSDEVLSPVCFIKDWNITNPRLEPPKTISAIEHLLDQYNEGIVSYKDGLDSLSISLYNMGVVCTLKRIQCFKSYNFRSNYEHRKVSPSSKCEQETYAWQEGVIPIIFSQTYCSCQ